MKCIARGCVVCLCALAALWIWPPAPTAAQTEPPLCHGLPGYTMEVAVSPTFRQDRTLFTNVRNTDEDRSELWRSQDGGLTWTMVFADPDPILDLALSPHFVDDHTLMLALYGRLAVSHDTGQTWVERPLPAQHHIPSVFPTAQSGIFVTLSSWLGSPEPEKGGTYFSADEGITWQRFLQGHIVAISPFFEQDGTMLANAHNLCETHICLSIDRGQTWRATQSDTGYARKLLFSPTYNQDHTLYVKVQGEALFRSTDSGVTWQHIEVDEPTGYQHVVVDFVLSPQYVEDHAVWIYGGQYSYAVSRDAGATWQPTSLPMTPFAAMDDCAWGTHCMVALIGGHYHPSEKKYSLYKSYDYGQTWQCLETPFAPPAPPPAEIPEPATLLLLAGGLAGLAGYVAQRQAARQAPPP